MSAIEKFSWCLVLTLSSIIIAVIISSWIRQRWSEKSKNILDLLRLTKEDLLDDKLFNSRRLEKKQQKMEEREYSFLFKKARQWKVKRDKVKK